MALSASTMKSTIISEMDAQYGPPEDPAEQEKFATAIANAFFTILTAQATVTVASVTGVTPGGGASGPGTGTIV